MHEATEGDAKMTLPASWSEVTLSEICRSKPNNGLFRKNPEYLDTKEVGMPVVWIEELFRGTSIDTTESRRIAPTANEVEKYGLKFGDLLFCRSSLKLDGIAFNNVYTGEDNKALFECHLIRVSPDRNRAHPPFLNWLLRSPRIRAQLKLNSKTATMTTIDQEGLCKIQLPLPPLSEQKRIAEILDRAEALRAKRRAALALLDELTQSIFLDIFGDPISNTKGWDNTKTLAEVASIGSGITKGRRTKDPVRTVPYMAVVNVQDKMLDLSVIKTIDATDKEIDRYRLKRNDLLLTEGGDADKLGRGTLWGDELPECIHQNHIFRVRPEASEVTPLFLNWLIGGPHGKSYFLSQAKQTTGIATINMTQLKAFPMLLPPLKLQDEFSKRILCIEDMRSSQMRSLNEFDQLFASLQHRAFLGEL